MEYRQLRAQVQAAGLLDRSGWNYTPAMLVVALLGVAAIGAVCWLPEGWRWTAAPLLAVFWMQVGFLGHDAGHQQIFPRAPHNEWLGRLLLPFLLGLSFRSWVLSHTRHHTETNIVGSDPDIENPVLAFTPEAARRRRGLGRWMARYQAWLLPLLSPLATLGFRRDGWQHVLGAQIPPGLAGRRGRAERQLELALMVSHSLLWVVLPSLLLGPTQWLPLFVLGQLLLGCYMNVVFAPNHKGLPTFTPDQRPPFLMLQLLTSRNVRGNALVDFLYGGLNYQIEHHLFPTMPRRHFPACARMVQAFCADRQLPYLSTSAIGAYRDLLGALDAIGSHAAGEPQRAPRSRAGGGPAARSA